MTDKAENNRKAGQISFARILGFVVHRWMAHPWMLMRVLAGIGLATMADIVTPVLAGRLVGDVSRKSDVATSALLHDAVLMVSGLFVLGLAGVIGRRSSYLGISHLTLAIMRRTLGEAFARVQRFSSDWHANNFAGSTVRRLTRGIWAIDSLNDTLLLLIIPEILVLVGTTLVLALRFPLMGLILAMCVVVFTTLSIHLALYYVAPASRISNKRDTKIGAALADSITCNSVVKAFGAEGREDNRLQRVTLSWSRRTLHSWVRGTNSANLQAALSLAMRIGLVGLVVWLWWRQQAGPADVAYVLTMVFLIQGYLRDLGQQVSQVQRSVNEMEELVAVFETEPGLHDVPDAGVLAVTKGEITLKNVTFCYPSQQKPLYTNLNLVLEGGKTVALVGPSGSGKTTLTRLIQRLYDVNAGHILIDGQDIGHMTQDSLRRQIALVPQEPLLFHRSLADNIAYGRPSATREDIREAACLANAGIFIDRLPEGYETMVGERGVKLSGGERQRVAIARAFLMNAPLVVFDEATASLDSESEILVQDAMKRLMQNRTVLLVAHRLSTVRDADRILVFQNGRVVEDGTHKTLMAKENGVYHHLVTLQSLEEKREF